MSDFKSNYGFPEGAQSHREGQEDATEQKAAKEAADGAVKAPSKQEEPVCEDRQECAASCAESGGGKSPAASCEACKEGGPSEAVAEPGGDPDLQVPVDEYGVDDDEIPNDPRLTPKEEINGIPPGEEGSKEAFCTGSGHNRELGVRGERAAACFLERRGMEIVERNWTCVAGEADIIGYEDETLHFVEVKTRNGIDKGFPSEAVTAKKRRRYEKIAACYLAQSDYANINVSFDIISIVVTGPNRAFLRYHRNAFSHWE